MRLSAATRVMIAQASAPADDFRRKFGAVAAALGVSCAGSAHIAPAWRGRLTMTQSARELLLAGPIESRYCTVLSPAPREPSRRAVLQHAGRLPDAVSTRCRRQASPEVDRETSFNRRTTGGLSTLCARVRSSRHRHPVRRLLPLHDVLGNLECRAPGRTTDSRTRHQYAPTGRSRRRVPGGSPADRPSDAHDARRRQVGPRAPCGRVLFSLVRFVFVRRLSRVPRR
jgi:hypothetical protein